MCFNDLLKNYLLDEFKLDKDRLESNINFIGSNNFLKECKTKVFDFDMIKDNAFSLYSLMSCDFLKIIEHNDEINIYLMEMKDTKKTEDDIREKSNSEEEYQIELNKKVEKFKFNKKFWDSLIIIYLLISTEKIISRINILKQLSEIKLYYYVIINEDMPSHFLKSMLEGLSIKKDSCDCRKLIEKFFETINFKENCNSLIAFNINIREIKVINELDLINMFSD